MFFWFVRLLFLLMFFFDRRIKTRAPVRRCKSSLVYEAFSIIYIKCIKAF